MGVKVPVTMNMTYSVIWGQRRKLGLFTLWERGPGHTYSPSCCFLSFQRLVEAAEEAHLKHEFDADLQVRDYSSNSLFSARGGALSVPGMPADCGWERKASRG